MTDQLNILIVDDRPENLLSLALLLESEDLNIVKAASGLEALEKVLELDFALILMDVQMPEMNGYEAAELLRGRNKTKNIPIIFVTAAIKEKDHIFKGYDAGAVDYLFKPIEPIVLKSKVGVFLDLQRQKIELKKKTNELNNKLIELEELQKQLVIKNDQLRLMSITDELTQIPNRRFFNQALQHEWKRGARTQKKLSLIMIDIDHFKLYNDHYGHSAGDDCLKKVSAILTNTVNRHVDVVARYGGEEFTVVLPETDFTGAEKIATNMIQAVRNAEIEHVASKVCPFVTISCGVSTMLPDLLVSPDILIDTADKLLYQAKEYGRNGYKGKEV